jgi:hypothetical protein
MRPAPPLRHRMLLIRGENPRRSQAENPLKLRYCPNFRGRLSASFQVPQQIGGARSPIHQVLFGADARLQEIP